MKRCSRCGVRHNRRGYYCQSCHNGYMRRWRKTNKPNEGQRHRDRARSQANVLKHRGVIVPQPCQVCGARKAEMHHPDHELPRDVVWLCRPCHLAWHAYWRGAARRRFNAWVRQQKKNHQADLAS